MAFDRAVFAQLLGECPLGSPLVYEPVVSSTMDLARAAGRGGAPHGWTALAEEQTAGRGRFSRRWVAPPGVNLMFTVLFRPSLAALERLSIVLALGVAGGVEAVTGLRPLFKWPNDILLDGRKLAGILIEAEFSGERPEFAMAGVGLNVNMETAAEPEIAALAVSLRDVLGHQVAREPLLAAILQHCAFWYERAAAGDRAVVATWAERLATLGQSVRVSASGQVLEGVAEGVSEDGALLLRTTDGTIHNLVAGEVTTRVELPQRG